MKYKYDKETGAFFTRNQYIDFNLAGLPNTDLLGEKWDNIQSEVIETDYDSEADTLKHIKRVNELLLNSSIELLNRAKKHDNSKLSQSEKPSFDIYTPKLKTLEYGSEEYKESLSLLKFALTKHYSKNSHHPEYYENGVNGMNLFDVLEMFLDWKAAGERHLTGDIRKSIEHNKKRFGLSDQLEQILLNTVHFLDF